MKIIRAAVILSGLSLATASMAHAQTSGPVYAPRQNASEAGAGCLW